MTLNKPHILLQELILDSFNIIWVIITAIYTTSSSPWLRDAHFKPILILCTHTFQWSSFRIQVFYLLLLLQRLLFTCSVILFDCASYNRLWFHLRDGFILFRRLIIRAQLLRGRCLWLCGAVIVLGISLMLVLRRYLRKSSQVRDASASVIMAYSFAIEAQFISQIAFADSLRLHRSITTLTNPVNVQIHSFAREFLISVSFRAPLIIKSCTCWRADGVHDDVCLTARIDTYDTCTLWILPQFPVIIIN